MTCGAFWCQLLEPGLCLLDLGSLLASQSAKERRQAKLTLWLDQRTHRSLRDSCGAIILAVYGADGPVAWSSLTERVLECRFGRIRSSFASGNLSCADYWRSSAVQMAKEVRRWRETDPPSHVSDTGKMSDDSFVQIANEAFDAAARFSAICAGISVDTLLELTNTARTCPKLRAAQANEDCEGDDPARETEPQAQTEAMDVVEHIKESQKFDSMAADADDPDECVPCCDEATALRLEGTAKGGTCDPEIAHATDQMCNPKETDVQDASPGEDAFKERFRCLEKTSLHSFVHKHENFEAMQTDLFMLLCFLRMSPQGCDMSIIRDHFMTRNSISVRVSKWHNAVRHQLAMLEMQDKIPAVRQSRVQGWVQSTERLREKLAPTLPSSLSIEKGHVIAAWNGTCWVPGLVLAVWRLYRKGNGSQLTAREISRGSLHSARIVMMECQPPTAGLFVASATSRYVVCSPERLSMRLDRDDISIKRGLDGCKVFLTQDPRFWGNDLCR